MTPLLCCSLKHFLVSRCSGYDQTLNYLGRYLKRPPMAMSRLRHYDGQQVIFDYLNHHTGRHESMHCSVEEFIERWTRHIPEKGFRMIRYYGFLANRVRSKLLPKVYELLEQTVKKVKKIRYASLLKSNFGVDPLICILCGSPMRFVSLTRGKTHPITHKSNFAVHSAQFPSLRPPFAVTPNRARASSIPGPCLPFAP